MATTAAGLLLLLLAPIFCSGAAPTAVPGCPDLDAIDELQLPAGGNIDDLLLCFCQRKSATSTAVSISCLYGSSIEHLQKAATAVAKANLTVEQLSIQHMEFPPEGINHDLLNSVAPGLARIDIRECAGGNGLVIHDDAFAGLEDTLLNVTVHDCKLKEVPKALEPLRALRTLILSSNDIEALHNKSFAGKKSLRYLDLSGNMINDVDAGAFADLGDLEALLLGDHNYVNDSMLEEIGRLSSLQMLDLSRADGVFMPPDALFPNIPMLKVLKLSGCSISALEPGAFSPLGQLEQLDLRVNLIENVSALAFDGLTSLRRLSLAGNYIREVESDHWAGLASLETLDLGWNELKEIDVDAFAAVSPSLSELDLRHNPIKKIPTLALPELKILNLSETNITEVEAAPFAQLPKLETVELARCNISSLSPAAFSAQKKTLKKLILAGNKLRDLPADLIDELPALEELSVASNPFRCDDQLGKFISSANDFYRRAAEDGRGFLLSSANDTVCSRPWSLRGEPIFELSADQLKPYDEALDTTTPPSTTAAASPDATTEESSTGLAFTLPNLFVGKESNESIFKDDRERVQYDLSKTDEAKTREGSSGTAVAATVGVIGVVSLIAILAVVLFIKKKRQVSPTERARSSSIEKRKPSDGMVEIELESGGGGNRGGGARPGTSKR